MSEMSPIIRVVFAIVQATLRFLAGLLALIAGVIMWHKHGADGFVFEPGDLATLVLIAALLVFALWLARGMGRELSRSRE